MNFGIMFFASEDETNQSNKYLLLLEAAKIADQGDFVCVWTPERHFNRFGGPFPNPALAGAAVAAVTRKLQIRAGSIVSPLHDTIRIVEDWSFIDNLSSGRVAVSFASGWNPQDFALAPSGFRERRDIMFRQIAEVRELWRTGKTSRLNGLGEAVELSIFPAPVQAELPIWVTTSGDVEIFRRAGSIGANVLTHLASQDIDALARKNEVYRAARAEAGFRAEDGIVSVMLHTFIGNSTERVRDVVGPPLKRYLRSSASLELTGAQGPRVQEGEIDEESLQELAELAFERYCDGRALFGSPESCRQVVSRLARSGVGEIACLLDFGVAPSQVLESLRLLREMVADS